MGLRKQIALRCFIDSFFGEKLEQVNLFLGNVSLSVHHTHHTELRGGGGGR